MNRFIMVWLQRGAKLTGDKPTLARRLRYHVEMEQRPRRFTAQGYETNDFLVEDGDEEDEEDDDDEDEDEEDDDDDDEDDEEEEEDDDDEEPDASLHEPVSSTQARRRPSLSPSRSPSPSPAFGGHREVFDDQPPLSLSLRLRNGLVAFGRLALIMTFFAKLCEGNVSQASQALVIFMCGSLLVWALETPQRDWWMIPSDGPSWLTPQEAQRRKVVSVVCCLLACCVLLPILFKVVEVVVGFVLELVKAAIGGFVVCFLVWGLLNSHSDGLQTF